MQHLIDTRSPLWDSQTVHPTFRDYLLWLKEHPWVTRGPDYSGQVVEVCNSFLNGMFSMPVSYAAPSLFSWDSRFQHVHQLLNEFYQVEHQLLTPKIETFIVHPAPMSPDESRLLSNAEIYSQRIEPSPNYTAKKGEYNIIENPANLSALSHYTSDRIVVILCANLAIKEVALLETVRRGGGVPPVFTFVNDEVKESVDKAHIHTMANYRPYPLVGNICEESFYLRYKSEFDWLRSQNTPVTFMCLGVTEGNFTAEQKRTWLTELRKIARPERGDALLVGANNGYSSHLKKIDVTPIMEAYDDPAFRMFTQYGAYYSYWLIGLDEQINFNKMLCTMDFTESAQDVTIRSTVNNFVAQELTPVSEYPGGNKVILDAGGQPLIRVRVVEQEAFHQEYKECGWQEEDRLRPLNNDLRMHSFWCLKAA